MRQLSLFGNPELMATKAKEFQIEAIEVIRVGKTKMAAYAIGKGPNSGMDWNGMNLRYRKLTPIFGGLSDCKVWLEQNFHTLKFVRYYKNSWSIKGFGGHYESEIAKQALVKKDKKTE